MLRVEKAWGRPGEAGVHGNGLAVVALLACGLSSLPKRGEVVRGDGACQGIVRRVVQDNCLRWGSVIRS